MNIVRLYSIKRNYKPSKIYLILKGYIITSGNVLWDITQKLKLSSLKPTSLAPAPEMSTITRRLRQRMI